jgi:amino acid adenylation domain-containing protein/non-ribosomal peptide synthase protein (TIGR01720 family)
LSTHSSTRPDSQEPPAAASPKPAARVLVLPASPAQARMWFLDRLTGGGVAYSVVVPVRLRGRLDVGALSGALDGVVRRHEVLRTTLPAIDGEPVQVVRPAAPVPLPRVDLSGLDEAARAREADRILRAEAARPFDLARGPLLRALLVRLAEDEHLVLCILHHAVTDGWSGGVIMREMAAGYAAAVEGRPSPVPEPPLQYADYAAWHREWLQGEDAARQQAYWTQTLSGAAVLDLPADRPRPAQPGPAGGTVPFRIPAGVRQALREVAVRQGATPMMALLAAWKVLLSRYAGQADVVVGTPVAGRNRLELEGLVGLFVNTLALRTDLDGDPPFREAVDRVRATVVGAQANQDLPFDQVVDTLRAEGGRGGGSLFEVMFVYGAGGGEEMRLPELTLSGVRTEVTTTRFDLELHLSEAADGATDGVLVFREDLYDRGTAERMVGHFTRLLQGAAAQPDAPVSALPLIGPEEHRQIVEEWNRTDAEYPADRCIHAAFEAQAARTPDAVALTFEDRSLTYAELNAQANRIAHHLQRRGVGPETRVGLFFERGAETVAAILGVLKAGGAYVPLDPSYPAERVAFALADSAVPVLLTQDALRDGLAVGEGVEIISLDASADAIAAESADNPQSGATPESLAYVIYTSGSTGTPKGALIEHRNVARLFTATDHWFGFGAADVWTLFHSSAFDFSVWEIWGALLYGGRLVVVPFDVSRDPEAFHALVQREGVTVLNQTPSAFRQFIRADAERGGPLALREVIFGGEALEPASLREWVDRHGVDRPRLVNMYGITETTVHVTYRPLSREDVFAGTGSPIGVRIPDLQLYVCDPSLRPLPVGVPGELYVGGAGVARGYLNRPELTAERFIQNPFGAGTLYRTGDRVRWRADGTLEYLGRLDEQVKIRGFRIELGEIESALLDHEGVREAAVVVREDEPGDRRIVAYVVGGAPAEALRGHLQERLPDYMVPTAFVAVDALPLTPNGKLDRKALPAPTYATAEFVAPRTPVEAALARIWADVLRLERVSVEENFFALGGDSILSIQVVARARRAGIEVSPRQVFQYQTIAGLAAVAGSAAAVAEQGRAEGPVALTPVQAWFFEGEQPTPAHHNQAVLLEVDPSVADDALEAALAAVLDHHDALRLRFRRTERGWEQWHADDAGIALERIDLAGMDAAAQDRAQEEAATARQGSLDLEGGPLGRAVLFHRGERGRVLLLALHHLVVDGVSWRILRDDLELACLQAARGETVDAGARSTSFARWSEALAAYAGSEELAAEAAYWRAQGPEGTAPLPVDGTGPGTVATARTVSVGLDAEATHALLHDVPAAYRTQINDVLLAALAQALGGWTGSPRVRIALEGHGREEDVAAGVDLTRTVGWFTSIYPVVLDTAGADGPGDVLKRVKEQLRAVPRLGIGYGVLRYLSPDAEVRRALAEQDAPQVSFNYLGQFDGGTGTSERLRFASGARGADVAADTRRRFLLDVGGGVAGGALQMAWTYDEGTHARETIERVAEAFLAALRALIAHCTSADAGGVTPSDFPLAALSQAELDGVVGTGAGVEDLYPLSPLQAGILFESLSATGTQAYQVQLAQRMDGPLDTELLRRAWTETVHRHAILRTSFAWEGLPRPLQRVHADAELPWRVEDWTGLDDAAQEAAIERFLADDRARGIALDQAPLMRCTLFRAGPEVHWFAWSVHHMLLDGWATARVMGEVVQLYRAWSTGGAADLPAVRPYRDYIAWLQAQDLGAAERFWRGTMAGFPGPTPLGADRPAAAGAAPRHAKRSLRLSPERTAALEALAQGTGVTMNTVTQAAWGLLLARYAGEEDVVFGATMSGRPPALEGVEEMIGLFINTLPVRMRVPGGARLRAWLAELQRTQAEAREYEYTPIVQVQAWSAVPRGTPLFESLYVFENYPIEQSATGQVNADLRMSQGRAVEWSTYPLALIAMPGRELGLQLAYDQNRFDERTIDRMLGQLAYVLEQVAEGGDPRLSALALADAAERRLVVEAWNGTDRPFPRGVTLHALFASHVRARPDAEALAWGDERLSYAELDARTSRLANHLRRHGVGPDARVGVLLDREMELIVAVLAIIKAGGCFVPLDPTYPAERLRLMLSDAGAGVLVTRGDRAEAVDADAHAVLLDAHADSIAAESADAPESGAVPENLAYIVYTSGSTGRPKGVMVEHRHVVQLVVETDYVRLAPGDRIAQASNPSFDALAFEMWGAFLNGATLVGIPRDVLLSPAALRDLLRAERITTLYQTTALLNQLSREQPDIFAPLREVLFGGQAVDPESVRRILLGGKPQRLLHMYGPTETTAWSSWEDVQHVEEGARTVSVGGPTGNQRIYILDSTLQPVPVGVAGEAYVGGHGVVRGYLERPSLTATRFVPDPFAPEPGARMYRTGDKLRWTADGRLEFVGRLDAQVKIRGFRIEPGEIESVLTAHVGVEEARVIVREDEPGEQRLVAYVVGEVNGPELREHLRHSLPEYMVPTAFVVMEQLPLTPNGKLDERALPALSAAEGDRYVAPRTPTEEVLAGIFAEVLKVDRAGADDSFFALGGHSLLAMQVVSRVREVFGVELHLRALFEDPTVEGMAARVDALRGTGGAADAPPIVPVERDGGLPLSFAQQRLWLIHQMQPWSAAYNVPFALRLRGALDVDALERAVAEIVRRHETLRTRFAWDGGGAVQVIDAPAPVPLPVQDLRDVPAAEREAQAHALAAAEAGRPFDLSAGPLLRGALLRLADDEHVLLLTMHHVICDGWSLGVLAREASALYDAFSRGEPSPLSPLPVQYVDFAAWQRGWLAGEVLDAELAWWRGRLAGAPPLLEIATDRPRAAQPGEAGGRVLVTVGAETAEALRALSRASGATLFMTLMAGWQLLLSRYSGQTDVSVGTPIAGRNRLETEGLIGFFVNTLVLRTDLSGNPGFRTLLGRVREATLDAYGHQDVPFERLVEELAPERSLAHSPLFQAVFTLQNNGGDALRLGALQAEPLDAGAGAAKFDLSLTLAESADGTIHGALDYRAELFDAETIERMGEHLGALLQGVAADPDRPVAEVPLLAEDERRQVVEAWNQTDRPFPRDVTLHALFDQHVRERPDAEALAWGDVSLSYAELDARANQLAYHLRRYGVGPDARVGVLLERSLELIVSILAIIKAGGCYVPLDPTYPAERLRLMLDDSGARVLVTLSEMAVGVTARDLRIVCLDDDADRLAEHPAEAPESGATPDNLAYIVYTSGSTGKPKGVMVGHRHVVQLVVETDYVRFGPGDRIAQASNASFDALAFEMWGAFLNGATLVGIGRDVLLSPPALHTFLREQRITTLYQTTALLNQLSREVPDIFAPLREVLFGGQQSDPASVRRILAGGKPQRLLHVYGPTETTAWCSYETVEHVAEDALTVSVGKPTGNQRIYILDTSLHPAPLGVPGEAYVGGAGIVRGYLERPGLTAERFVPDPFGAEPGARMYRTGDKLRWKADGTLEFMGRLDGQVKIRGFRIEPGEIESVLSAHPELAEARVVVREDTPGEHRLVAYVVGTAGTDVLPVYLRQSLPEYMVPAAFVVMDQLPLTPNGKLDVKALPAPEMGSREELYVAPRTPLEEALAGIWGEVLGVERVGIHEGFFELGGHSLLAMRVVSRVREAYGVELPLAALFRHTTIAGLAPELETLAVQGGTNPPPMAADDDATVRAAVDEMSEEELDRLLALSVGDDQ